MSSASRKASALSVADYFILKSNEANRPITNKKIQKLAYYAQAWSLALNNKKIFSEKIEAWVHGPVVKEIYFAYKKFGFSKIEKEVSASAVAKIPLKDREILDEIWRVYGKFDSQYLEMLTHSESPWQEARAGLESSDNSNSEITPASMKKFYSKKLEKVS